MKMKHLGIAIMTLLITCLLLVTIVNTVIISAQEKRIESLEDFAYAKLIRIEKGVNRLLDLVPEVNRLKAPRTSKARWYKPSEEVDGD